MTEPTNEKAGLPSRAGDFPIPPPTEVGGGYYYPAAAAPPEPTDWRRLARLLWYRKWWVFAAVVVGTVAGAIAARLGMDRVYQASATIWIEEPDARRGPLRGEEVFQGEGWRDVLRSFAVLEPVAVDERLFLKPIEPSRPDPRLFDDFTITDDLQAGVYELLTDASGSWTLTREGEGAVERGPAGATVGEAAGFRWNPPAEFLGGGSRIRFHLVHPRRAAAQVFGNLQVFFDRNASLITARLKWDDPVAAAKILNRIVDQFVATATTLKNQKQREVVEFLEEQTAEAAAQLSGAEFALENFKVQTITLPSEPQGTSVPGLSAVQDPVFSNFFQQRLAADQLEADIRQLEAVLEGLRRTGRLDVVALQLIQPVSAAPALQAAIDSYTQKELQRRTLLQAYTEQHPEVQKLEGEIRFLTERTIPSYIRDLIADLRTRLGSLETQVAERSTELQRIPARTIEEARLKRNMLMAEELHNTLLVRLKEAQLAEATNALPDMQVLDRAAPPFQPLQNNAPQLIVFASLASLGLSIGGILLHDRLDRRIRHPDQVSVGLGLPVLGVVPELDSRRLSAAAHSAMAIESFRSLRTQISHAGGGPEGITVITSPAPREGKSLVSANLAISYAYAGRRTVYVDGDTRRGRGHDMFGLSRSPGLTELLSGRATQEEVIQSTNVEGLDMVASGRPEGFNHELLDGPAMQEFLRSLRERYEVVILDSPPLAAGVDALVLGRQADKVLLVLRAGSTDEDLARTKLEMIGNVEIPIVGAVLNALPDSAPYHDYYVTYYYAENVELTG